MKIRRRMRAMGLALAMLGLPAASGADTIPVGPGESIQAAIAAALASDIVSVSAGTYNEDINFLGKAITVVGVGADSIIQGTGTGPVVTFANGEGSDSVLDSFLITGGSAVQGGGVFISGASPTVLRNIIAENLASSQGSGIYLTASNAEIYNNLIVYNGHSGGGDPHSIEIVDASPMVINNTIAYGDSNGLIIRGNSTALVMNNVIARNGSKVDGSRRGRGICDFSIGGTALIQYNLFNRNRVAALLTGGTDFRRIRGAQKKIAPPRLLENSDGTPPFAGRRLRNPDNAVLPSDFFLDTSRRSRAVDVGNPDPSFNDLDGTRNDAGFTGGPFAALP